MSSSKRPRPYDDPPSPESSSEEGEEEEEFEEDEQQPQQQTPSKEIVEEEDEEEEDEEEDEEEEEDDDETNDDTKNPTLTPKTPVGPTKKLAETDSETDTDDTDAQLSHKAASNYTIKPAVAALKATPKLVSSSKPEKGSKKDRTFDDEEDGAEKKGFITRLWGFNDEIAALQGMIDFKKEFNKDPLTNQDDFYNFVRVKLSNSKFTKLQVIDKVRRMKKKFKNNLGKSSGGKDPEISKNPHELKSFQLSKIVWGDEGNNNSNVVNNENGNSNNNYSKKSGASAKKAKVSEKVARVEGDMMEVDGENKQKLVVKDELSEFGRLYPHLMKAFDGESMPRVPLLEGFKGCLSKVDSLKLEEWDKKWKEVRVAETTAYVSRLALIQEQTSWFCNSMK